MLYPEDHFVDYWSVYITLVLLLTCIATPYRIAFENEDSLDWQIINGLIDFSFFVDMVIIFNSAYYDEDFKMVVDRSTIAC